MKNKHIYRITFYKQGDVYELYARDVSQSNMYAFVEVSELMFNERSQVLVDPSEEKLKSEFEGVKRTYIPLHSVIRIDEVEKQGAGKITSHNGEMSGNITHFPFPPDPGKKG